MPVESHSVDERTLTLAATRVIPAEPVEPKLAAATALSFNILFTHTLASYWITQTSVHWAIRITFTSWIGNIRKIRPFLVENAVQILIQVLVISSLDYCNALSDLTSSCAIKPLQMIQNAAARLAFNEFKRAHVTPLFIYAMPTSCGLHQFHDINACLQISHRLRTLQLSLALTSLHPLQKLKAGTPCGTIAERCKITLWWIDLPTLIRNAKSMTIFTRQLNTHLFWEDLNASWKVI